MNAYFNAYVYNEKLFFFRRILKTNPPIPEDLSPEVSDFISKLLVKDPRKRLGGGEEDAEELKRHPFFRVSSFPFLIFIL
jgi:ribosomal protein S6 kinase alpha-5